MTLTIWTAESGTSLGTIQERIRLTESFSNKAEPVYYKILPTSDPRGVTFTLISGALPPGLRLVDNTILGTPYEVASESKFTFCIRASKDGDISDRTFYFIVQGADAPRFALPTGYLDIGINHQYYVKDRTFVNYQILVFDTDIATGQKLSFFISSDEGELPPGLSLTEDGRIVGYVNPLPTMKISDGDGTYGSGYYDSFAYDFSVRPDNGYDTYEYDSAANSGYYDYNTQAKLPSTISRNYQFIISVTDGYTVSKRTFGIYVVGDDYFKADNTTLLDGVSLFTADATSVRTPVWKTDGNLGSVRANNYLIMVLDVYDTDEIHYTLGVATEQWAQNHQYKVDDVILFASNSYICLVNHTSTSIIDLSKWGVYGLPPGVMFNSTTSEIYGRIPYQPAVSKPYFFNITAHRVGSDNEIASTTKLFKITVLGEIDSFIEWISDNNIGTIGANYISNFKVIATTTIKNASVTYHLSSGTLPYGLSLLSTGEIIGKVNQFNIPEKNIKGLTTFDYNRAETTFDNNGTTVDRKFKFTIDAKDNYGVSSLSKEFYITVSSPQKTLYSNIKIKPFLKHEQRAVWNNFINDSNIFTPSNVYRLDDPNFGVQHDLSCIIYAGVESKNAAAFVSAIGLNNKRKQFRIGEIKSAVAIEPGTKNKIYEVVYMSLIDPLAPANKKLKSKLTTLYKSSDKITADNNKSIWSRDINELNTAAPTATRPIPTVSVDSTGYNVSDEYAKNYFTNSISIWRENISKVGSTERTYLPLWMRSIQPGTKKEMEFVLAVPLCYCKVGMSENILLQIKNSKFDFKNIDYTIDRYIIDSVAGDSSDKYLVFNNNRITI